MQGTLETWVWCLGQEDPCSRKWQPPPEFLTGRGAWWVTVHGVLKRFSDWTTATKYSVWCDHTWEKIWWVSSTGCFFLNRTDTFLALKSYVEWRKEELSPRCWYPLLPKTIYTMYLFFSYFFSLFLCRKVLAGRPSTTVLSSILRGVYT